MITILVLNETVAMAVSQLTTLIPRAQGLEAK
jgi:hypothetical protein